VRRRDEVARLVIQCEGTLESKEFVLGLNAAERKDACEFKLSNCIAFLFAKVLSLDLQSHCCRILR